MRDNQDINDRQQSSTVKVEHDAVFNLFILGTTIFSFMVVALLLFWPLTRSTRTLLIRIDTLICIIFVIDFIINLIRSNNRRDYVFRQWGWLELLGSVPIVFGSPWVALLRLARLPRLVGILRDLRKKDSKQIEQELRGDPKSALLFTVLLSVVMITAAGVTVLQIEGHSPQANIRTGADAFWWAFVTITTVGYGDLYPTSGPGRLMAMMLMTIGVGIFAVLTSYLASFLFGAGDISPDTSALQSEMKVLRQENAAMREQLDVVIETLTQSQRNED